MNTRTQRTIARVAEVTGIGFLTGADVVLKFHPAPANQGIRFLRTDLPEAQPIPALVDYTVPRERRTAISLDGSTVEMIEHVMAALSGLQIDNCLVTLNAPEPPGCDGSSWQFAQELCDAGFMELGVPRRCLKLCDDVCVRNEDRTQTVKARSHECNGLELCYRLDYGPDSPIERQSYRLKITPESFLREIAFARTFVLEDEARALQAQGYGARLTPQDLLIFGKQGVIGNTLRAPDECARHKLLDCIGDFALLGCDLCGSIEASRSGHRLNAELVRRVRFSHGENILCERAQYAA